MKEYSKAGVGYSSKRHSCWEKLTAYMYIFNVKWQNLFCKLRAGHLCASCTGSSCSRCLKIPLRTLSPGPKPALGAPQRWQAMGVSQLCYVPVHGGRGAGASQRHWLAKQPSRREAWSNSYSFFPFEVPLHLANVATEWAFGLWTSAKPEGLGFWFFFFLCFLNFLIPGLWEPPRGQNVLIWWCLPYGPGRQDFQWELLSFVFRVCAG